MYKITRNRTTVEFRLFFNEILFYDSVNVFFSYLGLISVTDKPYSWPKLIRQKKKKLLQLNFLCTKSLSNPSDFGVRVLIYLYAIYTLHTQTYTYARTHIHTHNTYNLTRSYKCVIQLLSIYKKKLLTKHKSYNKLQNNYTIHWIYYATEYTYYIHILLLCIFFSISLYNIESYNV